MAVLVPRTRTIGVRLSVDEYSSLERFCVAHGARCISDLARTAIFSFVNRAHPETAAASAPQTQFALVMELEQKLERLTAEIALLKAGISPAPSGELQGGSSEELLEHDDCHP